MSPRPRTLGDLRVPAAIFAGAVWAVAFMFGIISQDYVALAATTPLVMVAAGAIFTIRNGNGKDHP